jgi:hypothetical protein
MTMFVLAGSKGAGAETSATPSEFAVKAAFLYRFSSFIEWPKAVSSRDSFEIGIVGDDPFGSAFKPFMSQPIEGRQLRITRDPLNADSAGPQILFVSSSEADRITQLLQQVADKPVLTVSDIDGFAARGGILNFVLRDKKIRFGINVEAADRAGPKLSSRLLKLAEIVTTASAGGDDQVDQGTGGER